MFSSRFQDLSQAIDSCVYTAQGSLLTPSDAFHLARSLLSQSNIVYVVGNGGSAGIASHFSTDLIKTLQIPSQTLYDSNLVTCLSNDWGYDTVFSYPLGKLLKPGDLLVAISSSGKSPNIIQAVNTAAQQKIKIITLSGFSNANPLRALGDLNFWIDRSDYGLVETSHFFLLHTIIDLWNKHATPVREYAEIFGNAPSKN